MVACTHVRQQDSAHAWKTASVAEEDRGVARPQGLQRVMVVMGGEAEVAMARQCLPQGIVYGEAAMWGSVAGLVLGEDGERLHGLVLENTQCVFPSSGQATQTHSH